eukprot:CAMPEP_0171652698 /NCGR_PEP_ID=MMETSP0990-20121206/39121_1 /TAXON_ID=483369 /ORGANISM="non described non described, Strain CCMP2098" /LENGTH=63 /DNA_ID=CAMNT_0012231991 /DNA_START=254 /DNA_END=445 /DNA_ORIENTATION=+
MPPPPPPPPSPSSPSALLGLPLLFLSFRVVAAKQCHSTRGGVLTTRGCGGDGEMHEAVDEHEL